MAGVWKNCEICGRRYYDCCPRRVPGTFRWQSATCSPEHGELYLYRLIHPDEVVQQEVKQPVQPVVQEAVEFEHEPEDAAIELPEEDEDIAQED